MQKFTDDSVSDWSTECTDYIGLTRSHDDLIYFLCCCNIIFVLKQDNILIYENRITQPTFILIFKDVIEIRELYFGNISI